METLDQLPASIQRLCGTFYLMSPPPMNYRLLNLRQLELLYNRALLIECLIELLESSSPSGTTGRSVVSEISIAFDESVAPPWVGPEFCELTGYFSYLGQLLVVLSQNCPALQVLRLQVLRRKSNEVSQGESFPSSSTALGDRIVDIVNGCPSLERIELPVRVASAQCQNYQAMPWLEHCRSRGVEVWCCENLSSSSDYRVC